MCVVVRAVFTPDMHGSAFLVVAVVALTTLAAQQDLGPAAQTVGARLSGALWWHLEPWLGELAGGTDLAVDAEYRRALGACVHFILEAAGLLTLLGGAARGLNAAGRAIRQLLGLGSVGTPAPSTVISANARVKHRRSSTPP